MKWIIVLFLALIVVSSSLVLANEQANSYGSCITSCMRTKQECYKITQINLKSGRRSISQLPRYDKKIMLVEILNRYREELVLCKEAYSHCREECSFGLIIFEAILIKPGPMTPIRAPTMSNRGLLR